MDNDYSGSISNSGPAIAYSPSMETSALIRKMTEQEAKGLTEVISTIELAVKRLSSDEWFHTVISEVIEKTNFYPEALSEALRVSHSTIYRWMNEKTAPVPQRKALVYKKLLRLLKKELREKLDEMK